MNARSILLTSLIAGLLMALLVPASPAAATDRCVTEKVAGPAADRCMVITIRPRKDRLVSDFGATAGEPFDAQGNPVDRHGNVIASASGGALQVFASDR